MISSLNLENYIEKFNEIFNDDGKKIDALLLEDSPKRRSLLALVERFVLLDWRRNKFKSLAHPYVGKLCSILIKAAKKIQFSDEKIWFGGASRTRISTLSCCPSSSDHQNEHKSDENIDAKTKLQNTRLNSISYFSISIFMLGLDAKSDNARVQAFFNRLESIFAPTGALVQALMENDERFLYTMIALIRLRLRECLFSMPTLLDPDLLFLTLLRKIDFDPIVFIDWAYSEPELCFIFLKAYSQHFAQLNAEQLEVVCEKFLHEQSLREETNFTIRRVPFVSASSTSDNSSQHFHFDIEELHGEHPVFQRVNISTRAEHVIFEVTGIANEELLDKQTLLQAMHMFFSELALKLNKLADALNFPSERVCQNLSLIAKNIAEI